MFGLSPQYGHEALPNTYGQPGNTPYGGAGFGLGPSGMGGSQPGVYAGGNMQTGGAGMMGYYAVPSRPMSVGAGWPSASPYGGAMPSHAFPGMVGHVAGQGSMGMNGAAGGGVHGYGGMTGAGAMGVSNMGFVW